MSRTRPNCYSPPFFFSFLRPRRIRARNVVHERQQHQLLQHIFRILSLGGHTCLMLFTDITITYGKSRLCTGKKIVFRTFGFILSTLGSVPSNVFTVVLGTLNTFDGKDPKVDRIKPKVRNTIFFPCDDL